MSRTLITGWGLLAQAIAHRLEAVGRDWVALTRRTGQSPAARVRQLDLGAPNGAGCAERIAAAVEGPVEVIFHTAALVSVAACERDVARAYRDNVRATEEVVAYAVATGARVVFASTDWVFNGRRGGYTERDPISPVNVYGLTKAWAERLVMAGGGCVVRGTFIGRRPDGRRGLIEALADASIAPVANPARRGSPLWVGDFAEFCIELAVHDSPLIHVGSQDALDWIDLYQGIRSRTTGREDVQPEDPDDGIARPVDASLDVTLASACLGRAMPSARDTIERAATEEALAPSERG